MYKKIYIIWIWWIWISAVARYYLQKWYKIFWSDKTNSELISKLKEEWMDIIIWEDEKRIDKNFEKVIYSKAISKDTEEIKKAVKLGIKTKAIQKN